MDNQEAGPIESEDFSGRFAEMLGEGQPSEREAPTDQEPEQTVEATDGEVDAEAVEADAEAEPNPDAEVEAAEPDGEQPGEPAKFTVKVNGEEREVTLEDLQSGYMMQQDYSRKTQELADQRKQAAEEIQQERQQVQQQMAEYAQQLESLQSLTAETEQSVNWDELRELDPSEYVRQRELQQQRQKAVQEGQQRLQEQRMQQLEAIKARESELLTAAIPEWLDADVAKAETAQVRETFKQAGFNDQEVGSILDHRLVKMARDLSKAQARIADLEAKKGQIKEQMDKAAPLRKPQAPAQSTDAKKRQELIKKARQGHDGAGAALFMQMT